jgi:hypothetical protein
MAAVKYRAAGYASSIVIHASDSAFPGRRIPLVSGKTILGRMNYTAARSGEARG